MLASYSAHGMMVSCVPITNKIFRREQSRSSFSYMYWRPLLANRAPHPHDSSILVPMLGRDDEQQIAFVREREGE
eukprot:scaffold23690_cov32-Tisochrysis_lutea.AAC.6